MRVVFDRAIVKVNESWREKDEYQNKRNHHVVFDAATLI